jgi:predicted dehydrogenase/threonine dehydrogenase-like Zn-dependent dehydrogenase
MKQVVQYRRSGKTQVVDMPAPIAPAGGVLVHNRWSLISPGTERMLVEAGGANLLSAARHRPDLVKQVLDKARRDGIGATIEAVRSRIDLAIPLGYSCAGTVLDVGSGVTDVHRGDHVACAGAGLANHAEFVAVPRNLAVRVPDGVTFEDAAFVTVGAIALHGIRVADVRVGESCVVIGLGLVGQLTIQLLKAAGCRAFGVDLVSDKVDLARALGADGACVRSDETLLQQVRDFSQGRGADAVLITAATPSSDPVRLAAQLARDRAVIAAVGLVGMDVPRNAYYEKELDLRLSRSYGPGRYDRTYEELGIDYPIGYVRWTERRNMEAFLQLVAEGKVQPSRLVTHRIPIADAERAYSLVTREAAEPSLGILLQYPDHAEPESRVYVRPTVSSPLARSNVRLAVVGAGNFARSMLLPKLKEIGNVELRGVATASGPSAQQTATRFGFSYAASDWRRVVDDPDVDAVLVATRHDLHSTVAVAALRHGKAVFLEKPMALSEEGVLKILDAWRASGKVLQVGFNRRFAPATQRIQAFLAGRRGPLVLSYRVNAGPVAAGSWVLDPLQGGGRLVGEVCHMVDLAQYLAGEYVVRVFAQPLPKPPGDAADDVLLMLTFAGGSMGTITYAASGDSSLAKERLEIFGDGKAAVLDDFRHLTLHRGGRAERIGGNPGSQDKGHAAELRAFLDAVRHGAPSPIHPEDAAQVTRVTFAALESVRTGLPVELCGP